MQGENSSPEKPEKSCKTTHKRNASFSPQPRPTGKQSHEVVRSRSSNDSIVEEPESSFDIPCQQTVVAPRGRPRKRKSSETALLERRQCIKSIVRLFFFLNLFRELFSILTFVAFCVNIYELNFTSYW